MIFIMTEIADQIRALKLDKHVEIMLLGDPVKVLLLPLWANRTDIPNVHQAIYEHGIRCNIWNLADNADATCRMFPMDGTVNTGFDYCIVVYDAITRVKAEQLDKWITIKDQICSRQHPERKCQLVVIVVKTPRTPVATYDHVVQSCKKLHIHLIPVDNTSEGFGNIKSLLERLTNLVYQGRKEQHNRKVQALLARRP